MVSSQEMLDQGNIFRSLVHPFEDELPLREEEQHGGNLEAGKR